MREDNRIFRDLSSVPRILPVPYRLSEAGYLPDQVIFHRNRMIKDLYLCVILNTDGQSSSYVNGVKLTERNDVPYLTILLPGTRIDTINTYRHDEIFFRYSGKAADAVLSLGLESCHFGLTPEIVETISEIKRVIEETDSPLTADRMDLLALRFFAAIKASHDGICGDYVPDGTRFQELLSYVSIHACGKLDVDELVKRFGMSRRTFYRIWSRKFSIPFSKYLCSLRVAAAESLLAETNLTLGEIAARTGFTGGKYLIECFRREKHCSPCAFRKRIKAENRSDRLHL